MKHKVKNYIETCPAFPSQWDILLEDGRYVYTRYRWGQLEVRLTDNPSTLFSDKDQILIDRQIGEDLDGVMTLDELKEHTKEFLEWN